MRVYEIGPNGHPNRDLIAKIRQLGIDVNNHSRPSAKSMRSAFVVRQRRSTQILDDWLNGPAASATQLTSRRHQQATDSTVNVRGSAGAQSRIWSRTGERLAKRSRLNSPPHLRVRPSPT
jgi:hypothetical protein